MSRNVKTLYLVLAALLLLSGVVWAGSGQIAVAGHFRDQAGDKIRSDGYSNGFYYWRVDCAISWYSGNGMYFLRTSDYQCTPVQQRYIVLDFSDPVDPPSKCIVDDALGQAGTLNICGVNSVLDVRLVATKMFTSSALSNGTPVMLILNLQPVFKNNTYTNQGAFELNFEQNVPVSGSATSRTVTAGPDAVAELYLIQPKGSKVSLGRFRMPFSLTAQ